MKKQSVHYTAIVYVLFLLITYFVTTTEAYYLDSTDVISTIQAGYWETEETVNEAEDRVENEQRIIGQEDNDLESATDDLEQATSQEEEWDEEIDGEMDDAGEEDVRVGETEIELESDEESETILIEN